jgi:hypothetical protein
MPSDFRSWWRNVVSRRVSHSRGRFFCSRCLFLERLEKRILLSLSPGEVLGSAAQLSFNSIDTAQASGFLAQPKQVDFYQVQLHVGDQVNVQLNAQTAGSGLDGLLRVFNPSGQQVGLDDQEGGNPQLTFQATAPGIYYVSVSSAPNDNYNPNVANSGSAGGTTGIYNLNLRLTPDAPLLPDLTGASFRLGDTTVAWGQTVPVNFQVENRGGADAGAFDVQVLLSSSNLFEPASSVVLQTVTLPKLAAGQGFSSGDLTVTLPDAVAAKTAGLPASGPAYLGLRIDPTHQVPESNPFDQSGVHRGSDWETLPIVTPVPVGVTDLSQADPALNTRSNGNLLTPAQGYTYSFTVSSALGSGELTTNVLATGGTLAPRLTLSDASGHVLIQSDTGSIVQNLQPGSYSLSVAARSGTGSYQLTSEFLQADPPLLPANVGKVPQGLATADLTGDGIPDLIATNSGTPTNPGDTVSVLLGNGDGTFGPQRTYTVGSQPYAVAVADVNGDGKPDLIVANSGSDTVSVLLGNGDGTFQDSPSYLAQHTFKVGSQPNDVAMADLTGDGKVDLIVANSGSNKVSVLLGNGDGTFQPQQIYPVGYQPFAVAVADLNGDGKPDLVVSNISGGTASILLGNGDGTFGPQKTYTVGDKPTGVVLADLTGDGKLDLITDNLGSDNVSVLLGNGDGTFGSQQTIAVGSNPVGLSAADVNGDGTLDLVVANYGGDSVSVLLGDGDGTFQPQQTFAAGSQPNGLVVTDLNGDGKPDLIAADEKGDGLSILLGNGDGTFQAQQTFATGSEPGSVAVADLNGKGILDLAVSNFADNTVSILLGDGEGAFQDQQTVAVGKNPVAVALADLNGDGKPDLIAANRADNTVSVLLGDGDGTFQTQQTFPVRSEPSAVVAAKLTSDGKTDLIVANRGDNTISVLLGNGDGTFQPQHTYPVGRGPITVAVADVNGDGKPDLIVANSVDNTVSVLLSNGDGTFGPQKTYTVGQDQYPVSVAVVDVNGDGKPDLITANQTGNTVSVLLNSGNGTFQDSPSYLAQHTFTVGPYPVSVAVADVNGDGKPDLAVANFRGNNVGVLLGNGDGTFQSQQTYAVGAYPQAVVAADVNGDSRPDLITANHFGDSVSVLLGNGDGTFTPSTAANSVVSRNTPTLANLTGKTDELDSVILDRSGNILFRAGVPGEDGAFAPPSPPINGMVFNDQTKTNEEITARDLTVLRTPTGWAIATADAIPDPNILATQHQFMYSVSLYTYAPDPATGRMFKRTAAFATPLLATRIVAGDLTGDGLDDIVVADSLDNTIQVAFQQPDGTFSSSPPLSTGEAPSDVTLVDVNGDSLPDIVVSNQGSGDVSVFLNDSSHTFATSYRFRAGTGPFGLAPTQSSPATEGGGPAVSSLVAPVSLVAGDFTGTGRNDLAVVDRGSQSITVLANDGTGFAGPQPALTASTSDVLQINNQPGSLVAGYFNSPNNPLDLAVLMEDKDQVWIYTGDGKGGFTHTVTIVVPGFSAPSGISVLYNSPNKPLDLLMGNAYGDILRLQGNGDGTFHPLPLTQVSLNEQDLGNGKPDVLVANQNTNEVTVQAPLPDSPGFRRIAPPLANGSQSNLAPGAVLWAKIDRGSPFYDAIVVASGSNEVLIYRGTGFNAAGQPTFAAPVPYAVGTDPVSVTIAYLNGDGNAAPDLLVADQGSNDITELFGNYDPDTGYWIGRPGPRLSTGGGGPLSTTVRDVNGDGIPDLVVTNGQSGNMTVLPGVGQGFFNDQNPQVLGSPTSNIGVITHAPSFIGSSGIGVVSTTDGAVFRFNLNNLAQQPVQVFPPSAVLNVAAVQALDNGDLVAAFQNGEVGELAPVAGSSEDHLVQELKPLTGTPDAPSELEVVPEGLGHEVLVTSEGENYLYVFSFAPEEAPVPTILPPVLSLPEPTGPVAAPTDIPEVGQTALAGGQPLAPIVAGQPAAPSPLVLVVTLLAGNLPSSTSTASTPTTTANGLTTVATNRFTAPLNAENREPGEEDEQEETFEVAAEGLEEPGENGLGPPESDTLPQLELHEKTPPREPNWLLGRSRPGKGVLVLVEGPDEPTQRWARVWGARVGPTESVPPQRELPASGAETWLSIAPRWGDPGRTTPSWAEEAGLPLGAARDAQTIECYVDASQGCKYSPIPVADPAIDPDAAPLASRNWEAFLAGFAGSMFLSRVWGPPDLARPQHGPTLPERRRRLESGSPP